MKAQEIAEKAVAMFEHHNSLHADRIAAIFKDVVLNRLIDDPEQSCLVLPLRPTSTHATDNIPSINCYTESELNRIRTIWPTVKSKLSTDGFEAVLLRKKWWQFWTHDRIVISGWNARELPVIADKRRLLG